MHAIFFGGSKLDNFWECPVGGTGCGGEVSLWSLGIGVHWLLHARPVLDWQNPVVFAGEEEKLVCQA